jgi:hypothetical protein
MINKTYGIYTTYNDTSRSKLHELSNENFNNYLILIFGNQPSPGCLSMIVPIINWLQINNIYAQQIRDPSTRQLPLSEHLDKGSKKTRNFVFSHFINFTVKTF